MPRRPFLRLLVGVALVAGLTGCAEGEVGRVLDDDAACPGATCTDDTLARFEAIGRLDGVADVEAVSRSYGLDRGASRSAEVVAVADTEAALRDVGLAVLAELDDWPGQPAGSAVVVVRADVPPTEQVYADGQPLEPAFYEPCAPRRCDAAVGDLEQVLTAGVEGVDDLAVEVRGDRLSVTATAVDVPAGQAATAILDLVETDLGFRVADRVEVRLTYLAPLAVTLRLEEGRVCTPPPGQVVSCDLDNSEPFTG